MTHKYSPEAQAIIAAITSGNCCDECGAPNDQRHFDACSKHPENDIPKAVAAIVDASLDYLAECIGVPTMPRVSRELDELRAENAQLKRQVAGFDHFHGDCGSTIFDLREDLAAAHKRLEELGEKP